MSAKEATMLDELRNKELKALTDSEYASIRSEIESKGIRSLRGSSAQIVFAALRKRNEAMKKVLVEKHGNHDQSSHGSWANGGGKELSSFQQRIQSKAEDKSLIERVKRGANAYYAQQSKGVSFRDMERDYDKMEQAWREKDIGDPQDLAEGEFRAKYGASLLDIADFVHGSNLQLEKSSVEKHGNHDQRSHGRWSKDDSEGEFADTEGLHPKHRWSKDDSEGEFKDNEDEDIAAMDEMDLRHPPKPESYYQERAKRNKK